MFWTVREQCDACGLEGTLLMRVISYRSPEMERAIVGERERDGGNQPFSDPITGFPLRWMTLSDPRSL